MSIDQLMKDALAKLSVIVQNCAEYRSSGPERYYYEIQRLANKVFEEYIACGYIDEAPLVDLNHTEEIAYLDSEIRRIQQAVKDELVDIYDIRHDLATLISYRNTLAESVKPPAPLKLSLKNPETFMPYEWRLRDKYEH